MRQFLSNWQHRSRYFDIAWHTRQTEDKHTPEEISQIKLEVF